MTRSTSRSWASVILNVIAAALFLHPDVTSRSGPLILACLTATVGIWIEKGMGLVVTGFIPTPLGEIFEYSPTWQELLISLGIYAMGALVFTILTKGTIAIQLGQVGQHQLSGDAS